MEVTMSKISKIVLLGLIALSSINVEASQSRLKRLLPAMPAGLKLVIEASKN